MLKCASAEHQFGKKNFLYLKHIFHFLATKFQTKNIFHLFFLNISSSISNVLLWDWFCTGLATLETCWTERGPLATSPEEDEEGSVLAPSLGGSGRMVPSLLGCCCWLRTGPDICSFFIKRALTPPACFEGPDARALERRRWLIPSLWLITYK